MLGGRESVAKQSMPLKVKSEQRMGVAGSREEEAEEEHQNEEEEEEEDERA